MILLDELIDAAEDDEIGLGYILSLEEVGMG